MKEVTLPSGERLPAFGMGTWHIGDDPTMRVEELATLRLGLDLGPGSLTPPKCMATGERRRWSARRSRAVAMSAVQGGLAINGTMLLIGAAPSKQVSPLVMSCGASALCHRRFSAIQPPTGRPSNRQHSKQ